MRYLKIFETFNQDKKIEKVNDSILNFLISSYFEENTEVIAENDGYTFYVKGTKMKKPVLTVIRRVDILSTVYLYLNPDFFHERLKRYLKKCLGDQYFLEWGEPNRMSALRMTINSIKKYCLKKLNISNMLCILEIE